MNGKVVIITGAFGALGRMVAETALERGARVAGLDHAASSLQAATPDRIEIGGVDLSDAKQARHAIDAAVAHFGRLDALVNIAGGFTFETIAEGDDQSWQRMYALNVLTALNAARAAIPHFPAVNGRIVNVGAIGALQAGAGMGPYAASKAAVHRLTEALAAEHKGRITVNAVLPSTIDTPANRAGMPNADFAKWVTPRELAEVMLFLLSDAASAVTGALIPVSGRA